MKTVHIVVIFFVVYIPLAYFLFFFSLTPKVEFKQLQPEKAQPKEKLFVELPTDDRPHNEKIGYKTWYISSIADSDYDKPFPEVVRQALETYLNQVFIITDKKESDELVLKTTVRHFYGEYFRVVDAAMWELGTGIVLFVPRLVTDFIPYNHFAGRVAMEITLTRNGRIVATKSFDDKVIDTVSTYNRGSRNTASQLDQKATARLTGIFDEFRQTELADAGN